MARGKVLWTIALILGSSLASPIPDPQYIEVCGPPPCYEPCPIFEEVACPCVDQGYDPCSSAQYVGDAQLLQNGGPGNLIVVKPSNVRVPQLPPFVVKPPPVQPPAPAPITVKPAPVQPPQQAPIVVRPPPVQPPQQPPITVQPQTVPVPKPAPIKVQPQPVVPPQPETILVVPPKILVPAPPTIVFQPNPPTNYRTVGPAVYRALEGGSLVGPAECPSEFICGPCQQQEIIYNAGGCGSPCPGPCYEEVLAPCPSCIYPPPCPSCW